MKKNIAVIGGDGIGVEITAEAIKVLNKIAVKYNHEFEFAHVLMGGVAIDETGVPLPEETVKICKASDAVLLGAVGGPKWDTGSDGKPLQGHLRPEAGLLGIRAALGLFANIRPVKLFDVLADSCVLKNPGKIDLIIVRELIGGAYFGKRETYKDESGARAAYDTMLYRDWEIERIAEIAFKLAQKRSGRVCSVDKANVLDSSRLWREVVWEVYNREKYKGVTLSDMLVDNCAMQLVRDPSQFDIIVTENLFGDILSDEASVLTGSLGMLPSASLAGICTDSRTESVIGMYEPCHGSAPDIAGQDKANPLAMILSAAMMLRLSFDMDKEALDVENAVERVLAKGLRTGDIYRGYDGTKIVGCAEMGAAVTGEI
ncbi:MAG: 3-isopropylmalate dehydrogenase [Oscillospiraceae bacterium]|jgi:3-isopropylmalate dehydrogenase|nr:3-isopropylmalate dehydrogenase [Oscillospiraceae bacterium]